MSIEQKALEIAESVSDNWEVEHKGLEFAIAKHAARLGIIEGLEMGAVRIDALADARRAEYNALENKRSEMAREIITRVTVLELAATAIRALIKEQKV